MAYKYGHPATALNGVALYIQRKYPQSSVTQMIRKSGHFKALNDFMREYRKSRSSNPSKDMDRNAMYIQNNFTPFAEYCKQKLQNGTP